MRYSERAISFACAQETLAGILAIPHDTVAATGVVVIVGGPQYRAGSHRQFVLLSRALAAAGFPVLRFDYRGMGDSTGEPRDFLQVTPDVAAAIDAMQRHAPSVQKVALWGLCDGASAALLYCHDTRDTRVAGLCLLNPWVRSEASLARAHVKHYYRDRIMQKEFWIKLFTGKVAGAALVGLLGNLRTILDTAASGRPSEPQTFQQRMSVAWGSFDGHILLILSGNDYTAKEFLEHVSTVPAWQGALQRPNVSKQNIASVDHTFSSRAWRHIVENHTLRWIVRIDAKQPA